MRVIILAATAFGLAACNAANRPGRGELFMEQGDIAAKDDAICRGYGAVPGTPAYINCRTAQDQRRDAYKEARRNG